MTRKIIVAVLILLIVLCGACIFAICWNSEADGNAAPDDKNNPSGGTGVEISIGTQTVNAVLYDTPYSNEFLSKLPLTLSFSDYNGTEKIAMLPENERLNTEGAPNSYDPSIGDIAYYVPWGNICVFYQDFGVSEGLVSLGKIEGDGIDIFAEQTGNFEVTISITDDTKNVLVAYFSWSTNANTEGIAEKIAELTGGDLFEIIPEVPYTTVYNDLLDIAGQELSSNARPAIQNTVNIEDYNTIYIGFPIWHSREPMIINTFLESYDFTGKTIIPFSTSGSSSGNSAYNSITNVCPEAEFLTGLNLTSGQLSSADGRLNEWLRNIGQL